MPADFGWQFRHASRRVPVLARSAAATSHPLATAAAMDALSRGGTAADAATAAAITLTVVEPTMCGAGGDAFAIIHDGTRLHGLNASGRAPSAFTAEVWRAAGAPRRGSLTVTVPGVVSGWVETWKKFGNLPFPSLFVHAVRHAREGYAVTPTVAAQWAESDITPEAYPDMAHLFPGGRAPAPGEIMRMPDLADALEDIAETAGESFYTGALAARIAAHAAATGGLITEDDLAAHGAEWVEPLAVDAWGVTLHELPPNGQGLAALIACGILSRLPGGTEPLEHGSQAHRAIEATKLALAEARAHIADPAFMTADPHDLIAPARLDALAARVDRARAVDSFPPSPPPPGGTVYLCTADASGMMVSFIQSNFRGFGSGVIVPGTGIALSNRATGFSADPAHPNCAGPRKRPYHTIIPGFVTRSGKPLMAFGLMGGEMQPQGHLQLMARIFRDGENPQEALDAPRWRVEPGMRVNFEPGYPADSIAALEALGHDAVWGRLGEFGAGQAIMRMDNGIHFAASDWRRDGHAAGT